MKALRSIHSRLRTMMHRILGMLGFGLSEMPQDRLNRNITVKGWSGERYALQKRNHLMTQARHLQIKPIWRGVGGQRKRIWWSCLYWIFNSEGNIIAVSSCRITPSETTGGDSGIMALNYKSAIKKFDRSKQQ